MSAAELIAARCNRAATEGRHRGCVVHLYEIAAATAALRAELEGGAAASLPPRLAKLAELLERRSASAAHHLKPTFEERALLRVIEALPLPAGILDQSGKLRFANGALLRLRRDRRISPQLAIDVAASETLTPLKQQALEGHIVEGAITLPDGERTCQVRLAPLGGEVALLLDDRPELSSAAALLRDLLEGIASEAWAAMRTLERAGEHLPATGRMQRLHSEIQGVLLVVETAAAQLSGR